MATLTRDKMRRYRLDGWRCDYEYVSRFPRDEMRRAVSLELREYRRWDDPETDKIAFYLRLCIESLSSGHLRLAGKWARSCSGGWLVDVGLAEDIFAPFTSGRNAERGD
jgi:hypothetical protein